LRLAKEGYCNGNPTEIEKLNVSAVIKMFQYEVFLDDFSKEKTQLMRVD
jgi:hypothetical protein